MTRSREDPTAWRFILDEWVCCDGPPSGEGFGWLTGDVALVLSLPREWPSAGAGWLVPAACPTCGALAVYNGSDLCCIRSECGTRWLPLTEPGQEARQPPEAPTVEQILRACGAARLPGFD